MFYNRLLKNPNRNCREICNYYVQLDNSFFLCRSGLSKFPNPSHFVHPFNTKDVAFFTKIVPDPLHGSQ